MGKYIIAGIDPGATVGIAIIDLLGKRIALRSTSGGMADAVRIIETYGTPSLVATDVTPAPDMAIRLASYFSCRLYAPRHNVREEEKRQIARGAGVENNHERDAYAAAVLGFRAHANKLRQIETLSELANAEKDRVKHLMLKGYRLTDAFASLSSPSEEEPREEKKGAPQRKLSPDELRLRISSLARENAHLRLQNERLEGEKRALEGRMRLLENGVRQTVLRDSELRTMRFRLERALEKLTFRYGKKRKGRQTRRESKTHQPSQKIQQNHAEEEQTGHCLNKLDRTNIDLEKLVADYRKGRK